jgi:hypothetical protein
LLAGCGGTTVPAVVSPGGAARALPSGAHGRSLLYVSNGQDVLIYTYPRAKRIGSLSGFAGAYGLCTDAAQDIFVPFIYDNGGVYEFPHGGQSPIAFLGFSYGWAHGCSVDPKTGSLAVIGGPEFGEEGTYVTVYHHKAKRGWRLGRTYPMPNAIGEYCAYDDASNLFCDGKTSSGTFVLDELPSGASAFSSLSVDQTIDAPGGIQWDGAHLAIGDSNASPSTIYQFDIEGSAARKTGATPLDGSNDAQQFWIQGKTVIAPDPKRYCGSSDGCIGLYAYPAGGSAVATIPQRSATGAAVSLRP